MIRAQTVSARCLTLAWLWLLAGCATPHRPPTVAPARVTMERLAQRHFLDGAATPAERETLARLLDLHGRGDEAALLEAPTDPARAERAWFAGPRSAPFTTSAAARAGLPDATARLASDPRAIRTLWLLAHSAGLDPHFLRGLATRWRADWPDSAEARVAQAMSDALLEPDRPEPVDLVAWASAHPMDVGTLRAADAAWRAPSDLADQPRWAAVRVLAAWRASAFDVLTTHVPRHGPLVTTVRRLPFVPTAADRVVHRLGLRVWGPTMVPRAGAPTPIDAEGGAAATVVGVPAHAPDSWAPSDGPRWVRADVAEAEPQRATMRWRLTPAKEGWRGTLTTRGLAPRLDGLRALYPGLTVRALRRLPAIDGVSGWRAQVAFAGAPRHSLLHDAQIEALGGPIAMQTLAEAPIRRGELQLAPAAVEITVTTPHAWSAPPDAYVEAGWRQRLDAPNPNTVRRRWQRPGIDWAAGVFPQRRAAAEALQARVERFVLASAPVGVRRLLGAPAPNEE